MKKTPFRIIALLMSVCFLLLSGCRGQESIPAKTPEEFWARAHEWKRDFLLAANASNDYGYYYIDTYGILNYLDYTTRESVVLCNQVDCHHRNYKCEAFFSNNNLYMFFRDEKMYLITDDKEGMHIFRCDLDATNREEKILLMKDEMEKGNAVAINKVLIDGNDLYYTAIYQESSDDSGEKKNSITAVRRVDLKTWVDEEIIRTDKTLYSLVSTDADGVLVFEQLDPYRVEQEYADSISVEEWDHLTLDQIKGMPVSAFYCDKKTHSKLTLYESNYADTDGLLLARGECLYRIGHPKDASGLGVMGLEKMNMRTGEAEWLWNEELGPLSSIRYWAVFNNCFYFTLVEHSGDEEVYHYDVYSVDSFKKLDLPFLEQDDEILFHDAHGYVMDKMIEERPDSEYGNVVDTIFVPIEEADKENPDYIVLVSWGQD